MVLINTNRTKRPLQIENSKESKNALLLEKRLLIDLNTILEFIKDNFDFKSTDYIKQLEIIQKVSYSQTYSIIRYYYQQAYQIGTDYANEVLVSAPYLTNSDIDYITKQSENHTSRFYGRLKKVLQQGNMSFIKSLFDGNKNNFNIINSNILINQEEQIKFFATQLEKSSTYLYTSLAVLIITEALNHAVVQKSKKLLQPELKPKILQAGGAATNKILEEILEEELEKEKAIEPYFFFFIPTLKSDKKEVETNNKKIKNIDVSNMKYGWVTRMDEKVCPICSNLEGTEYTLDNIIPDVVDVSHFNCRCRIVLKSGSEIIIE